MVQEEAPKEKKNKCLYGFEKRPVYHELINAWQGYYNLSKEEIPDEKIKRTINA
jgi:hypothetical protein